MYHECTEICQGLFENKIAFIFGGCSHLRTRSNILFKMCTVASCSSFDPFYKARYNRYDRGGGGGSQRHPPYNYTPPDACCRACFNGRLEEEKEELSTEKQERGVS